MKNLFILLFTIGLIICSCKRKEDLNPDGNSSISDIEVSKTFHDNLLVKGGTKLKGDINKPTVGDFGFNSTLSKSTIESDPITGFNVGISIPDGDGIIFFKVDNTDEYFKIKFDKNGIINQKSGVRDLSKAKIFREFEVPMLCGIPYDKDPLAYSNRKVKATIQVYTPPKVNGKFDETKQNEKKYYCAPQKITFNLKPFSCDLQRTSNEFLELSNLINSSNFGVTDCEYVLAKYDQLVKSMLTCKDISASDKKLLTDLNNDLQGIDCSIFSNSSKKEFAAKLKTVANNLSIN
jgi:hypothetical protein